MVVEDGDFEVDKSISLYRLNSSDAVVLEELIPQKCWKVVGKERIIMLGKAMSSLSKPLRRVAVTGFQVSGLRLQNATSTC